MVDDAGGVVQEALEGIQLAVDGGRPSLQERILPALLPVPHLAGHRRRVRRSHIHPNLRIPCASKHDSRHQPQTRSHRTPKNRHGPTSTGSVPVIQDTQMEEGE